MNWKFIQDLAYDICTGCSAVQRAAHRWRDPGDQEAKDPLVVASICRKLARFLIAAADKIEAAIEVEKKKAKAA
jgi:hypothetical protein